MATIIISSISLTISCATFALGFVIWNENKRRDRRDLRLQIHERLVAVDLQRGRRILYNKVNSIPDARSLYHDTPDEYDLANRALAMLDLAALYAVRGYIDEESFLDDWDYVYANISDHCRHFIAERAERSLATTLDWPHFQRLAMKATERRIEKQSSLSQENPP